MLFHLLISIALQLVLIRKEMYKHYYVLQAILCTHDAVAQKDYYPHLPDVPPELDDEEETVKIVQLVKSDEPLVRY